MSTKGKQELKPCPFCKSLNLDQNCDRVECLNCFMKGPSTPWGENGETLEDEKARVVKHWNTRAEAE